MRESVMRHSITVDAPGGLAFFCPVSEVHDISFFSFFFLRLFLFGCSGFTEGKKKNLARVNATFSALG